MEKKILYFFSIKKLKFFMSFKTFDKRNTNYFVQADWGVNPPPLVHAHVRKKLRFFYALRLQLLLTLLHRLLSIFDLFEGISRDLPAGHCSISLLSMQMQMQMVNQY